MKVVIDTCSMLSLVRYYLPFDKEVKLLNLIHTKVQNGEIILLDKVVEECRYVSNGTIVSRMPFLLNRRIQQNTTEFLPDTSFFDMLENELVNQPIKRNLSSDQFENEKNRFLRTGDAKIILYGISKQKLGETIVVVTEETVSSNDKKTFKKIPAICEKVGIESMTLPQLIETYPEIDLRF